MREMMGTIAAIFIIMLLLPMFARYQQQGMDNVKKRQAADHLAEVNHAVAEYVRGNYETLLDLSLIHIFAVQLAGALK